MSKTEQIHEHLGDFDDEFAVDERNFYKSKLSRLIWFISFAFSLTIMLGAVLIALQIATLRDVQLLLAASGAADE